MVCQMSHDLSQLRKFVSPEIIFGAGCRHSVANYVKTFGARKVLLVSDPGVLAAGWVADIQASLGGGRASTTACIPTFRPTPGSTR